MTDAGVVFGLLISHAARVEAQTFQRDFSRDQAYLNALDRAITDGEEGKTAPAAGRPRWLSGVVTRTLDAGAASSFGTRGFGAVRRAQRAGVLPVEETDTFVLAAMSSTKGHTVAARAGQLRADPELLEILSRKIFEVEGGGEVSLASLDKYVAARATWADTFVLLVSEGDLDRATIVDWAVDALQRDFASFRVGWFRRFLDLLALSDDELGTLQTRLARLLDSPVKETVSWALKLLSRLAKAGRLEPAGFLRHADGAVRSSAKATSLLALTLLKRLAQEHPDEVVAATAWGLEHPLPDVQAKALALLTDLGAHDVIAERAEGLAPSLRQPGEAVSPAPAGRVERPSPSPLELIPEGEVIARLAGLLEHDQDALTLELVLAGLVGLPDPATALTPLVKRAKARRFDGDDHGGAMSASLAHLILTVTGDADALPGSPRRDRSDRSDWRRAHLRCRIWEVAESLINGGGQPLLATPTDTDGFIEPMTLVGRMSGEPLRFDFMAALRRVGLTGRPEALPAAADLPGQPGAALRYALGGGEDPRAWPDLTPGWWIAAARARAPAEVDGPLHELGFVAPRQAAPGAITIGYEEFSITTASRAFPVNWWPVIPQLGDPDPRSAVDPQPEDRENIAMLLSGGWRAWAALDWPHDAEFYAADMLSHLRNVSGVWTNADHNAVGILDALRLHPGQMGTATATALALGLSAKTPAARLAAIDATATLLAQGRVTPELIAAQMAFSLRACVPTRWATALAELAAVDAGAARGAVAILSSLLPLLDPGEKAVGVLLECLREESLRAGIRLDAALDPWLVRVTGSGKAARLAKTLRGELARGELAR